MADASDWRRTLVVRRFTCALRSDLSLWWALFLFIQSHFLRCCQTYQSSSALLSYFKSSVFTLLKLSVCEVKPHATPTTNLADFVLSQKQRLHTSDIALATLWLAISPQKSPMAAVITTSQIPKTTQGEETTSKAKEKLWRKLPAVKKLCKS